MLSRQAAEKALKAVCLRHALRFRYTHDLAELIAGIQRGGISIPTEVEEAAVLTNYAWETRYPGLNEPVTLDEYREAIECAETVVLWAEREIGNAAQGTF